MFEPRWWFGTSVTVPYTPRRAHGSRRKERWGRDPPSGRRKGLWFRRNLHGFLASGTSHANRKKKGKGRSVSARLSFLHAMVLSPRHGSVVGQRRRIETVTNQPLPVGARTRLTVKPPKERPSTSAGSSDGAYCGHDAPGLPPSRRHWRASPSGMGGCPCYWPSTPRYLASRGG